MAWLKLQKSTLLWFCRRAFLHPELAGLVPPRPLCWAAPSHLPSVLVCALISLFLKFICLGLCWIFLLAGLFFVAVHRFLIVVASCCGAQALHGLSCYSPCRIFLDQGSNTCPLHWQVDSCPLDHQGSLWAVPHLDRAELTQTSVPTF